MLHDGGMDLAGVTKIDAFAHISPRAYQDRAASVATGRGTMVIRNNRPVLYELDRRFRVMDLYPDYRQIVTLCMPTLEEITGDPAIAHDLARLANDSMADRPGAPDRFVGSVGRNR